MAGYARPSKRNPIPNLGVRVLLENKSDQVEIQYSRHFDLMLKDPPQREDCLAARETNCGVAR